jgi:hypothetical protein
MTIIHPRRSEPTARFGEQTFGPAMASRSTPWFKKRLNTRNAFAACIFLAGVVVSLMLSLILN